MSANRASQRWTFGLMAGALLAGVFLLSIMRAAVDWEQSIRERLRVKEGRAHDATRRAA